MQATLESLNGLERRLNVSLPLTEIDTEVSARLKKIARTAKLAGFRPGKVPLKIVEQQFGPQVRQEVLGDVVKKSFGDAVREQNLRVAGLPSIEPRSGGEGGGAFEYSATFEVYPEVTVTDVSSLQFKRPVHEIVEADVDRTLEILRRQRVKFDPVERPAAAEDLVTIDYRGTIDGVEFPGGSASDHGVILGQGRLLPEFESHLVGLSAGATAAFDLQFPDTYHGKDVAGKTARFEVTLQRVAAPRLPDLDAEFAKQMGIEDGDLEKLRAEVRSNVEREIKARVRKRIKDQVMQALLDANELPIPKSLVDMEAQRLTQATMQDLASRGVDVQRLPFPAEGFETQARRRVSLGLILAELVRAHDLGPRPEQVRAVVEEHAQSFEHPREVVKWYYQVPERLNEFESVVLEDNVVQWVTRTAQVEDEAVGFDELMGNA
ncbi:MAG: trigger factor [Burkholderiales bacterium]|nr:trigger factor [Burkholderiales bacterium]